MDHGKSLNIASCIEFHMRLTVFKKFNTCDEHQSGVHILVYGMMGRYMIFFFFFLSLVKPTAENNWSKLATISHYNPTLILEGFEILLCDCQDNFVYILKSAVYNTRPT